MNAPAIIETAEQAATTRHGEGVSFRCAECGGVKPTGGHGCGTGYARDSRNRLVCYSCADAQQRAELRDHSRPFCAYVSGDGRRVTTWTGGTLGLVTSSTPCRLTRRSWVHGASFASVRVRDVHGGLWFGRGSPGVAISLRPCKARRVTA